MSAFRKAAELGADMWEIDIRVTADGVPVVHHDEAISTGQALRAMSRDDLRSELPDCPDLGEVIALAAEKGAGLYADIKDEGATLDTLALLRDAAIEPVILGAFSQDIVRTLNDAGCPYPVAGLVPVGADPHVHAEDADIIHLCWEHLPRPQDTLTPELFARAFAGGKQVVLWHEEDPDRMRILREKPVTGICSDMPEMVKPFQPPASYPFDIVSHRGANRIAPENTLPALQCALAGGISFIEVDLSLTSDGEIVVMHDKTLDRTTDGAGPVSEMTLNEIRSLDAGAWFDPHFAGTKVPSLSEILDLLERYHGHAYLELKTAPPKPVLDMLAAAGLLGRVFFWSFNREFLLDLRELGPTVQIMARRQDYPTLEETVSDFSANIVEFLPTESELEIASLRGSEVKTMVAYMGSDEATFKKILGMRPDIFNLNDPFGFASFIRRTYNDA